MVEKNQSSSLMYPDVEPTASASAFESMRQMNNHKKSVIINLNRESENITENVSIDEEQQNPNTFLMVDSILDELENGGT